jgi:micrococcal nuclease
MINCNIPRNSRGRVKRYWILVIALFTVFAPLLLHGHERSKPALPQVQVVKVHDGDTVTLMINGRMRKTRLIGIDAPEMNQRPWGRQAKEHLIDILNHTDWRVTMETDVVTTDKYGRSLVYLWTKNKELINERMVLDGYAVMFTIRPNITYADRFKKAEQHAREEKIGIWGPNGLKEKPIAYKKKHPRKHYELTR